MFVFLCCLLSIILLPDQASAWGGGAHLEIGLEVIRRAIELPPHLAILLMRFPDEFLYGCVAADITIGKKFTYYLQNCHRWGVGERLLQVAETDRQRACAYGYLCHLAADVVAHNYYVPFKTVQSFASVTSRHTYWELRFEDQVDQSIWKRAKTACKKSRDMDNELLRRVVTPTIFSFGASRRIFNSIMLLSRLKKWQQLLAQLSSRSSHKLSATERQEFFDLSVQSAMDLFIHGQDSGCRLLDPTGEDALTAAAEVRQILLTRYQQGEISKEEGVKQAEAVRPLFRQALYQPELLKELHQYFTEA
ncbi:MAG: zinc dependent phospholipase C family protein [Trichlorobacter sp.]|nr:zinc dependent phospholipase C family protein [Trichlorobacter sp.]